jgi:hypothetical protein
MKSVLHETCFISSNTIKYKIYIYIYIFSGYNYFNKQIENISIPYTQLKFCLPVFQEEIDFSLGPDGCADEKLLALVRQTIQRSVDTGHPHFYNQLYGAVDPYGLAGAWVSEALNTSQ